MIEIEQFERNLKIPEFCKVENMSKAFFYKLQQLNLAPEITAVPGTIWQVITPAARRAWQEKIANLNKEKAALLEKERRNRAEQAAVAGKKGGASPKHPCRPTSPAFKARQKARRARKAA